MLLEQVLCLGLAGLLLLLVAGTTIQIGRASQTAQLRFEARQLAASALARCRTRALEHLPLGQAPVERGELSHGAEVRTTVEVTSLDPPLAALGLTDQEIRAVRVTVEWRDSAGEHQERAEGFVVRMVR